MSRPDDVASTAERLYALPPEQFTAARDAAAKQAGDKGLREAVKGLRRPTVPAWLVNRLARDQPELLEQLLALGPALAQAQAAGSGEALRDLGRQRRELVQAVTGAAVEGGGREVTATARGEVEQTLEAALADPAAAEAVRSGALVRALTFVGFGGVDVEGAVGVPAKAAPRGKGAPRASAGAKTASRQRRKPDAAVAERAALDAAAALDDAVRACEDAASHRRDAEQERQAAHEGRQAAEQEVARLEEELAGARERLAAADHRVHEAQRAAARSGQAAERATRRVEQAQQHAEAARSRLDALRRG